MYYPWGRDQVERDDSGKVAGRRWVVGKEADLESSHNSNSKVSRGAYVSSHVPVVKNIS